MMKSYTIYLEEFDEKNDLYDKYDELDKKYKELA